MIRADHTALRRLDCLVARHHFLWANLPQRAGWAVNEGGATVEVPHWCHGWTGAGTLLDTLRGGYSLKARPQVAGQPAAYRLTVGGFAPIDSWEWAPTPALAVALTLVFYSTNWVDDALWFLAPETRARLPQSGDPVILYGTDVPTHLLDVTDYHSATATPLLPEGKRVALWLERDPIWVQGYTCWRESVLD